MTMSSTPFRADSLKIERSYALRDYRMAVRSRQVSLLGRQEVLTGKAKFGIFGDGKEIAQLAMAYAFQHGDVRSGYYRDQTFMFALELLTVEQFFAQLYAHADPEAEPWFGGRAMTGHFATHYLGDDGGWLDQLSRYNSTADLSPTAAQMPKLVGLGYASKLYRAMPGLQSVPKFSDGGQEVAFGTIGNASCAEGLFWEAMNAMGVLQVPVVMSVWDDGYGISVPNDIQMTKNSVSEALRGFAHTEDNPGFNLYRVRGWDYPNLCRAYLEAADLARRNHVPALMHVNELTQPQGHSTSGSHERYKSPERLAWEREFDCLVKMSEWLEGEGLASTDELAEIEQQERTLVRDAKDRAYQAYREPLELERSTVIGALDELVEGSEQGAEIGRLSKRLERKSSFGRRDLASALQEAQLLARQAGRSTERLDALHRQMLEDAAERYGSDLYAEGAGSALNVEPEPPRFDAEAPTLNGFEIFNQCFDHAFGRTPELIAIGEDVGRLGDVNQGMADLQQKYGELRITDTGIREATIIGQAIGLATRGLRPIAEIQYLDYILYALQVMSDDLATLRWRTRGRQAAPVIVRTRGHRLEGIWHSGSPMAGILNLCRGIFICVPRDATRAAGMYNTLLESQDTAVVVEVLNGYRKKEQLPDNLGTMKIPLGVPEVLRAGGDVTVVTYGALCWIALEAAEWLAELGIDVEVIDVQTLEPFDREGMICESLKKTNRVLFLDEDVPGGTTAYMLQQALDRQGGFHWLDAAPRTLSAAAHRPPYGSDGDYFAKPNRDSIVREVLSLMHETDPGRHPLV